jgi:hypothetical protein
LKIDFLLIKSSLSGTKVSQVFCHHKITSPNFSHAQIAIPPPIIQAAKVEIAFNGAGIGILLTIRAANFAHFVNKYISDADLK